MPQVVQSSFTRYRLSSEEQRSGESLTPDNLCVIQNLICDAAEEKLNLKYDPTNPMQFAQREAELQGQIGVLKLLAAVAESHFNQSHLTQS